MNRKIKSFKFDLWVAFVAFGIVAIAAMIPNTESINSTLIETFGSILLGAVLGVIATGICILTRMNQETANDE